MYAIMAEEDPFFIVKDEVLRALEKSRELYQRWKGIYTDDESSAFDAQINVQFQDPNWLLTELKNKLRSIDWDLEDLEEALVIAENNSKKFNLDAKEIQNRRAFIAETLEEVKQMKDDIVASKNLKKDTVQAVANLLTPPFGSSSGGYTRLQNELESPNRMVYNQTEISIEESLRQSPNHQDIGNLTSSMINQPKSYADEQAVMLDNFAPGIHLRDPNYNSPFKRVARVLHLTDGKKQVTAAGVLVAFVLLFFVMWV